MNVISVLENAKKAKEMFYGEFYNFSKLIVKGVIFTVT